MICPLKASLPTAETCRSHRREHREALDLGIKSAPWAECGKCGRDLGAKAKDMGGSVKLSKDRPRSVRPDAGYEVTGTPYTHNVVGKPAPPTKDAQGGTSVSHSSGPVTAEKKQVSRKHPISKRVPDHARLGGVPHNERATVRPSGQEGRATGKDAPHPIDSETMIRKALEEGRKERDVAVAVIQPHNKRYLSFMGSSKTSPTVTPPPQVAVSHRPEVDKRQRKGKAREGAVKTKRGRKPKCLYVKCKVECESRKPLPMSPSRAIQKGRKKFTGILKPCGNKYGSGMKLQTRPGFVQTWEPLKRKPRIARETGVGLNG